MKKWASIDERRAWYRIYNAKYRANNPEKLKAHQKKYCDNNPERRARTYREYYERNRDLVREKKRIHRVMNYAKYREKEDSWAKMNPEKRKASVARWHKNNPEFGQTKGQNRRAMKIASGGTVSADQWKKLKIAHGPLCVYCHETKPLTMDHVIPLSRGGRHSIENIVPACLSCNSSKKDKMPDEFRAYLLSIG